MDNHFIELPFTTDGDGNYANEASTSDAGRFTSHHMNDVKERHCQIRLLKCKLMACKIISFSKANR